MMDPRRIERDSQADIECEVPRDMTLREWRCTQPAPGAGRPHRVRAAAAALGRATRRRKRVD
jgi:hypothetical protein